MSPPLLAAVALLGAWMLMVFAITNAAGVAQWRAAQQTDGRADDGSARSGSTAVSDD